MSPEEELINAAFEILGELLVTAENAREEAVKYMMYRYCIDTSIAVEVVSIAFERWMEIYDPE